MGPLQGLVQSSAILAVEAHTITAEKGGPQLLDSVRGDALPCINVIEQQQHHIQSRLHAQLRAKRKLQTACIDTV